MLVLPLTLTLTLGTGQRGARGGGRDGGAVRGPRLIGGAIEGVDRVVWCGVVPFVMPLLQLMSQAPAFAQRTPINVSTGGDPNAQTF